MGLVLAMEIAQADHLPRTALQTYKNDRLRVLELDFHIMLLSVCFCFWVLLFLSRWSTTSAATR